MKKMGRQEKIILLLVCFMICGGVVSQMGNAVKASSTYANPTIALDRESVKPGDSITQTIGGLSFDKTGVTDVLEHADRIDAYVYGQSAFFNGEWFARCQEFEEIKIGNAKIYDANGNRLQTKIKISVDFAEYPKMTITETIDYGTKIMSTNDMTDVYSVNEKEMNDFVKAHGKKIEDIYAINFSYDNVSNERFAKMDAQDSIYKTRIKNDLEMFRNKPVTLCSVHLGSVPNQYFQNSAWIQKYVYFNTTEISEEINPLKFIPGKELDITMNIINKGTISNNYLVVGVEDVNNVLEIVPNVENKDTIIHQDWEPKESIYQGVKGYFTLLADNNKVWQSIAANGTEKIAQRFKVVDDFQGENLQIKVWIGVASDLSRRKLKTITIPLQDYNVKFDSNGGSIVDNQEVLYNQLVLVPHAPKRTGYNFVGWYQDKELKTPWDFKTTIVADTTLYAKWDKIEETPINPITPTNPDNTEKVNPKETTSENTAVITNLEKENKNSTVKTWDQVNVDLYCLLGLFSIITITVVLVKRSKEITRK